MQRFVVIENMFGCAPWHRRMAKKRLSSIAVFLKLHLWLELFSGTNKSEATW
jgi:hypothetical protein